MASSIPAGDEVSSTPDTSVSSVPVSEPVVDSALGLRNSDRLFVVILSALILFFSCMHLVRMSWRGQPTVEIERLPQRSLQFQIDINRANWVEWMQLPEIGETVARQIVADRAARGPFTAVQDVSRVKGIGPVTMEKIRPYLRFQPSEPGTDVTPPR